MAAAPPAGGLSPTPAVVATPPAAAVPPAAPPPAVVPPVASPPPPPAVPPPGAPPPLAATPPALPPPPPVAPPPPALPPPPPATPPPAAAPPPAATATPPAASPPPAAAAVPPAATPAGSPPPAASPPPPANASPPPPANASPPPPANASPPPPPNASPPPPVNASPIALSPPPPPTATSPTTSSSSSSSSGISTGVVVGIAAVGGVLALVALFALIAFCRRKKKRRKNVLPYAGGGGGGGGGAGYGGAGVAAYKVGAMEDPKGFPNARLGGSVPLPPEGTSSSVGNSRSWFTYDELRVATNGFAAENILGEGGFGRVYKGELPNGQVVAVKQLTLGGGQGDREFRAEVEIISRVHHRHLVSLVGYCIADKQRLLVYDFVPNGTLDVNLYGKGKPVMTWGMRVRVALGAARGLAYLHEDCHPRIIHRDIKSSNILLDDKYEAQVADFGLAKLASDTNTHVSTRVMGTFGYLAPEYAQSGKLTEKSDVYSFGVVLLELLTGRKPIDQRNPVGQESLVEWARPLMNYALDDGNIDELIDPRLGVDYDVTESLKILEVAASCVRHTASKRPKMGQVVRALESEDLNNIHQGLRPGQSSEHESDFDKYGGDYDTQAYNADMLRSRNRSGANKPYGSSSEYTSEYITSGPGQHGNSMLAGDGGSSSEFEPIIPKPRDPGPVSVRTGRTSLPRLRPSSTDSYTSLPPVRAAPPRPDFISDDSGSLASDMFVPPPPPPNFSDEYAPIDFGAAKSLRDGR